MNETLYQIAQTTIRDELHRLLGKAMDGQEIEAHTLARLAVLSYGATQLSSKAQPTEALKDAFLRHRQHQAIALRHLMTVIQNNKTPEPQRRVDKVDQILYCEGDLVATMNKTIEAIYLQHHRSHKR